MSYLDRENSLTDARPVRLYQFSRQGVWTAAFTSADRDITYQGVHYVASAITDDGIRLTGETSADTMRITAPANAAPAQLYRGAPPSDDVWVTLRDYHYGDPDALDSAAVVWVGTVSNVRWTGVDRCEIACDSLGASMRVGGLRLTYERSCPHTVYDTACRVLRSLYRCTATVIDKNGAQLTYSGTSGGQFAGGFVEWVMAGGLIERRGITAESGALLTLLGGTDGIEVGQEISLFPGCDQSIATCQARFSNAENYGGFRHMPGKSPFSGEPVF